MSEHTKDVIELQKWWMNELKAITKKVIDQEDRRQAKVREKAEKSLGEEYNSFMAVQDAYGCGVISSRKRDRLYDLLEQRDTAATPDHMYQMKVDLLTEFYQMAKQIVEDNTR